MPYWRQDYATNEEVYDDNQVMRVVGRISVARVSLFRFSVHRRSVRGLFHRFFFFFGRYNLMRECRKPYLLPKIRTE